MYHPPIDSTGGGGLLTSSNISSFLASRGSPPGTWVGKGPGRNYGSVAAPLQLQALCLGVQVTEELPLLPRLKILSFRGGGQQCHGQRLSRSGEATLLTCLQYLRCTAPFGNEGLGVARSMAWSFEFVLNLSVWVSHTAWPPLIYTFHARSTPPPAARRCG